VVAARFVGRLGTGELVMMFVMVSPCSQTSWSSSLMSRMRRKRALMTCESEPVTRLASITFGIAAIFGSMSRVRIGVLSRMMLRIGNPIAL